MITDRLKDCPFCGTALSDRGISFKCLDCPNESSHSGSILWVYYDDMFGENEDHDQITAVNIQHQGWQLSINLQQNITKLINRGALTNCEEDDKTFDCLMDFELTQENIERKIKTLLTFS